MNELRPLILNNKPLRVPFVYDALQARIAEQAGFPAIYMTGFGTAAARGLPDVGLLSATEMIQAARQLAEAVDIPLICDADTGYGNAMNVQRTVKAYEQAGVAAMHIEDQVWPKRCGFMHGKQVIPLNEMLSKVKAAVDSAKDILIIARTDALQPEGWNAAVERVNRYYEAGADMVFVDGIRNEKDLTAYISKTKGIPKLYNGTLAVTEMEDIHLIIDPTSMMAIFAATLKIFKDLKQDSGSVALTGSEFRDITKTLGLKEMLAIADRFSENK